jgi:hypothetical protein
MFLLSMNAIVSTVLLVTVVARGGHPAFVAAVFMASLAVLILSAMAAISHAAQRHLLTVGLALGLITVVGAPDVSSAALLSLAALSSLMVSVMSPRTQLA